MATDVQDMTPAELQAAIAQLRAQQDYEGQGEYYAVRHLSKQPGGWADPDLADARRVIQALNPGKYSFDDIAPGK